MLKIMWSAKLETTQQNANVLTYGWKLNIELETVGGTGMG
jgi:hypothetical protein